MVLEGNSPLTINERIGILLASVVSFLSIIGTVWYAAIAVNNLTHEISTANTNISKIEKVVTKQSQEAAMMFDLVNANQRDVSFIKKTTPKVLDISTKYVLMTSDGESFKLVRYKEES